MYWKVPSVAAEEDGRAQPRRAVSNPRLDRRLGLGSGRGARREPFNPAPIGVNSISSGSPHVYPTVRTCGEPNKIKKNTHLQHVAARVGGQDARRGTKFLDEQAVTDQTQAGPCVSPPPSPTLYPLIARGCLGMRGSLYSRLPLYLYPLIARCCLGGAGSRG